MCCWMNYLLAVILVQRCIKAQPIGVTDLIDLLENPGPIAVPGPGPAEREIHSLYYPVGISGTDDWYTAERECSLQFLGGHLPSARTDEETQYIAYLTEKTLGSSTSWLGFTSGPCETVWAWTDEPEYWVYAGSCLCACQEGCFSAWISGEPDFEDGCAYGVATLGGVWSGTACQGGPRRRFLCEVPIIYKYVSSLLSWYEASLDCHNQGGNLASIWSAQENARIQSICRMSPCWFGMSDQYSQYIWIFEDYETFTVFIADEFQGTSISYTNWVSTGLHSGCALLNSDGTWIDKDCSDHSAAYICAIPITPEPTAAPTYQPTDGPTSEPSVAPTYQPTPGPTSKPSTRQVLTLPNFQPSPQHTFQPTEIPLEVIFIQALEEQSRMLQQQMDAMNVKLDTIVGSLYPAETLPPSYAPSPSLTLAPTSRPACEEETGGWVYTVPLQITTPQGSNACCKQCIYNEECKKWQFQPPVLCILLDNTVTSTVDDPAWTRGEIIE